MTFKLHAYQRYCADRTIDQPAIALLLGMGLGKTVTTLTAIDALINDCLDVRRVLVVAPKRVAEQTWPAEIKKWPHLQHLTASVVAGTPTQRKAALQAEADLYIIGRDNVTWLAAQDPTPFDMIVLDELSSFKNHQAKRFKAMKKLRSHASRVVGLTGTPSPNGYLDLWAQMYLLDRGERLGRTITAYRNKYFLTLFRGNYNEYQLRPGAKEEIDAKLADLCISMKAEDYLKELKEPVVIDYRVKMTDKEWRQYKAMERQAVLELDDEWITAANAAAVSNKLLQMANGAIYDETGAYTTLHDHKLDALEDLMEQAMGSPVLVAYAYKSDLERIQQRFPEARKLETGKDIEDWNAGRIPMLLAHPASCGHGLNLQQGGSILVWFGFTWSLELYLQTNARLHRQGQKDPVRIYRIVNEGTMDEKVLEVLKGKNLRQEKLLQELKAEIKLTEEA